MATSKMMKPGEEESSSGIMGGFDFGDPEILPVEISAGKLLYLILTQTKSFQKLKQLFKLSAFCTHPLKEGKDSR